MQKLAQRDAAIDIAKGIGIIFVIIGHSFQSGTVIHEIIYSFHMPLFFILSGTVMNLSNIKNNGYKCILADKKLLFYIFYSIIFIIYDLLIKFLIFKEFNMINLFWDTYQTISFFGINVLWFLTALMGSQLVLKVLIRKINNKYVILIAGFIFCVLIMIVSPCLIYIKQSGIGRLFYYPLCSILRGIAMVVFIATGYYSKYIVAKAKEVNAGGGSLLQLYLQFPM